MKFLKRWFVTREEHERVVYWLETKIEYMEHDIERLKKCISR